MFVNLDHVGVDVGELPHEENTEEIPINRIVE